MVFYLTFAAYCLAHLDDIAAKFVGWLFTPFSYGGKHRRGFDEVSDFDRGGWDIRMQSVALENYLIERTVESLTAPKGSPTAAIGTWRPAGVGEDGEPETPGQLTPQLDPLRPRRYVLDPDWRERSGEIPVARMGELVEMAT